MDSWSTIESDPGVFTEMIEGFGVVKDQIQAEELFSFDEESFNDLQPIYGLVFLFKWDPKLHIVNKGTVVDPPDEVFFAKQIVQNACATQAILSILLNLENSFPEIDIGTHLTNFKSFTKDFPPDLKGNAIGDHDLFREVHNNFARPEPFIYEQGDEDDADDSELYHFVSFLPINGILFEFDGLKSGPILHENCTLENWTEVARKVIIERTQMFGTEIRFNLMAIVKNRVTVLNEKINELKSQKEKITDDNESALSEIDSELETLEILLSSEEDKRKNWKIENVRRQHNYIPFFINLLKISAQNGFLENMEKKAKQEAELKEMQEKSKEKDEKEKSNEDEKKDEKEKDNQMDQEKKEDEKEKDDEKDNQMDQEKKEDDQ